jgi:hypothetical protein
VLVPEKRVPHFKAGKELRERVDRTVAQGGGMNGNGHAPRQNRAIAAWLAIAGVVAR